MIETLVGLVAPSIIRNSRFDARNIIFRNELHPGLQYLPYIDFPILPNLMGSQVKKRILNDDSISIIEQYPMVMESFPVLKMMDFSTRKRDSQRYNSMRSGLLFYISSYVTTPSVG